MVQRSKMKSWMNNWSVAREGIGAIAAINIYDNKKPKEQFNVIDTFVTDSVFHIYKVASGKYYDNGIRLFFKANVDTNYHTESFWKIGDDPRIRNGNNILVDFW